MNSLAFFLHSPSNTKRQGSRSRKRTENNQGEVMSHPPEQPAEPFQNVFVVCYPQSKAETHSPIHTHTHTHTHTPWWSPRWFSRRPRCLVDDVTNQQSFRLRTLSLSFSLWNGFFSVPLHCFSSISFCVCVCVCVCVCECVCVYVCLCVCVCVRTTQYLSILNSLSLVFHDGSPPNGWRRWRRWRRRWWWNRSYFCSILSRSPMFVFFLLWFLVLASFLIFFRWFLCVCFFSFSCLFILCVSRIGPCTLFSFFRSLIGSFCLVAK